MEVPNRARMHMAVRVGMALLGLALILAGILYGVLGVWGVFRSGDRAWILAAMGAIGFCLGAWLVAFAIRGRGRKSKLS